MPAERVITVRARADRVTHLILSLFFSSFALSTHPLNPPHHSIPRANTIKCPLLQYPRLRQQPLSLPLPQLLLVSFPLPYPSSYPCSSLYTASHNGPAKPSEDMSVAEIKEQAKQQALRGSRGVSALSLIRSAKGQISLAQSREGAGDLKSALSAFTKAASLTQVFMDSAEFKAESAPGKRGLLWREFTDFQQVSGTLFTPYVFLMLFSMREATLRSVPTL
jgi:hypothetical protein